MFSPVAMLSSMAVISYSKALLVSPTSISSTFPVAVCVTVARLARGYSSTVINPSSQAMTPRFGILARKDSDTTASSSSLFLSKIPDCSSTPVSNFFIVVNTSSGVSLKKYRAKLRAYVPISSNAPPAKSIL